MQPLAVAIWFTPGVTENYHFFSNAQQAPLFAKQRQLSPVGRPNPILCILYYIPREIKINWDFSSSFQLCATYV